MSDLVDFVPTPAFADRLVDHGVEDGIEWITATAPLYGAVNGYVHVPEGHPWRGLGYDGIDVRVNGGLTYGGGEWFGFDTLHAGDWWPGMQHDPDEGDTRWTPELVSEETRNLARQAAEAAKRPTVSADLVEFLTARLDDDWAESLRWSHNIYGPDGSITGLDEAAVRVQREVEAKRRILEEHDPGEGLPPDLMQCPVCDGNPNHADYPCRTLRLLTLPYADHPDYRQEWKP